MSRLIDSTKTPKTMYFGKLSESVSNHAKMTQGGDHTILSDRAGDVIGSSLHVVSCIAHRNPDSRVLDKWNVIAPVPESHALIRSYS